MEIEALGSQVSKCLAHSKLGLSYLSLLPQHLELHLNERMNNEWMNGNEWRHEVVATLKEGLTHTVALQAAAFIK